MKRFIIVIRWRSYRWTLSGAARNSCDLLAGLLAYVPEGARVMVRRT